MTRARRTDMNKSTVASGLLVGALALAMTGCATEVAESTTEAGSQQVDGTNSRVVGDGVLGILVDFDAAKGIAHGTCTATLIADKVVLTAAHCVVEAKTGRFTASIVYDGLDYPRRAWSRAVTVEKTVVYPGYDINAPNGYTAETIDAVKNDLAMLVLSEAAPANIRRVPLADADSADGYSPGAPAFMTGYGLTSKDANDSGIKRNGISSVFALGEKVVILAKGDGTTSLCGGDSGGPLQSRRLTGELTGVASFVTWDGKSGVEQCKGDSVYMRVSAYRSFIDPVVAANP